MTTSAVLSGLAARYKDAPALLDDQGSCITFRELEVGVGSLAGALRDAGVHRGQRVATLLPNSFLPVELLFAAGRLGAVTIPLNTRLGRSDLQRVLQRAKPTVLIAAEEIFGVPLREVVEDVRRRMPSPPPVLWSRELATLRRRASVHPDMARDQDLLVAFATSGTTGQPKLAAHDHSSTLRHLRATARSLAVSPSSRALLTLPLCGTFGFVSAAAVLAGGGRVVVPPRFLPEDAAALVERHRVTHLNGSDDMLLAMLDAGCDLSSWRHGVTAEFTGRALEAVLRADEVGARITGVYGQSETFAILARWSPGDAPALRSRAGGVMVDRANRFRVVGQELQVRGPSVLSAYLSEDGDMAPVLSDGWFATGDCATMVSDSAFRYISRMQDSLRLRGFLTDPVEIEHHLLGHPAVRGAQVVGSPLPTGAETAVAFVIASGDVTEHELLDHCRGGLANYKVPGRISFVSAFPTQDGPNGTKIRKDVLRERAASVLAMDSSNARPAPCQDGSCTR